MIGSNTLRTKKQNMQTAATSAICSDAPKRTATTVVSQCLQQPTVAPHTFSIEFLGFSTPPFSACLAMMAPTSMYRIVP